MKFRELYVLIFAFALFDAQTVVGGAVDGVKMAISVVIPSLFPFILISILSSQVVSGRKYAILRPIEKLCGMPDGSGSLLVLGLCGGYPVGAQCVVNAYENGMLSKEDAQRLLGFCNNAGPSFIFGMIGGLLKNTYLCWLLWLGQILSAIIVGALLPGKSRYACRLQTGKKITVADGLEKTIIVCSKIAGWVIIFRALLAVADKWILHQLPPLWNAGFAGLLELANGCIRLQYIDIPLYQFLLCGSMLAFGGACVHLQTKSVANTLSLKWFYLGKLVQTIIILPILLLLWKISVAF